MAEQSVPKSTHIEMAHLLWNAIDSGATLKEIQGVSDSVMDGLYAYAYKFYQLGNLDDAEVFFRFLCLYDAYNAEYRIGLAATLQQKKQYQEAIQSYELAFALAKKDYRPKLHIGQCYLFMKNRQQARESFLSIVESDAPAPLKAQAQAYLGTIKPTESVEKSEALNNNEGVHDGI